MFFLNTAQRFFLPKVYSCNSNTGLVVNLVKCRSSVHTLSLFWYWQLSRRRFFPFWAIWDVLQIKQLRLYLTAFWCSSILNVVMYRRIGVNDKCSMENCGIKGLKLRQNSTWNGNCNGEMWRHSSYPGAAVDERRGTWVKFLWIYFILTWVECPGAHLLQRPRSRRGVPQFESFCTVPIGSTLAFFSLGPWTNPSGGGNFSSFVLESRSHDCH